MSYKIISIPNFDRELKRLAKKYPSIKTDMKELVNELIQNPTSGTSIGNHCYKIRLSVSSKGKGKSGGARVITYIMVSDVTVFLISIYDKSEKENINEKELLNLLKEIP